MGVIISGVEVRIFGSYLQAGDSTVADSFQRQTTLYSTVSGGQKS